jgi:cleavage stimulation factor subunit 3
MTAYFVYVLSRKINSSRQNFNTTMQKSFEFALSACGQDKDAGAIWSAYIAFVKGWDVSSGQEAYATRRNELRGIYKRAVSIPLENLEQLWKDYEEFENLDKQGVSTLHWCVCSILRSE